MSSDEESVKTDTSFEEVSDDIEWYSDDNQSPQKPNKDKTELHDCESDNSYDEFIGTSQIIRVENIPRKNSNGQEAADKVDDSQPASPTRASEDIFNEEYIH